jgi:protein tyrosine/serine phosphatase
MKCCYQRSLAIAKWLGLIIVVLLIFFGARYALWRTHVHPVVPGVIYRSGQISPNHFSQAIEDYQIRSMLNLRGQHADQLWYQQEINMALRHQVQHYDLALHANKIPTKAELQILVDVLLTSPKPLLIHCEGGADRTGLALAVYMILQNEPLITAEKQYSLNNYVIHRNSVGKQVIPAYAAWLQKNHLETSRDHFLKWLSRL